MDILMLALLVIVIASPILPSSLQGKAPKVEVRQTPEDPIFRARLSKIGRLDGREPET
jgi:hypothetical protein